MKVEKGDLILATNGESTTTCIVLSAKCMYEYNERDSFYYTYCLETGLYGLVYSQEILSVVSESFAPDFEFDSQIFDTNYDFYETLLDTYSYWPYFWGDPFEDIDDDTVAEEFLAKTPDKD
jgi:hypothetical protein